LGESKAENIPNTSGFESDERKTDASCGLQPLCAWLATWGKAKKGPTRDKWGGTGFGKWWGNDLKVIQTA